MYRIQPLGPCLPGEAIDWKQCSCLLLNYNNLILKLLKSIICPRYHKKTPKQHINCLGAFVLCCKWMAIFWNTESTDYLLASYVASPLLR